MDNLHERGLVHNSSYEINTCSGCVMISSLCVCHGLYVHIAMQIFFFFFSAYLVILYMYVQLSQAVLHSVEY